MENEALKAELLKAELDKPKPKPQSKIIVSLKSCKVIEIDNIYNLETHKVIDELERDRFIRFDDNTLFAIDQIESIEVRE